MATDSPELSQIAAEAKDIARNVAQPAGTQHLLLATFTVPGPADVLLRERGCDEDKVLSELAAAGILPADPPDAFAQALEKARQLADDCGHAHAEGLHLLVALTRVTKCAAAQLLDKTAAPIATLRTTALGYLTGSIPRRRETTVAVQTPRAAVVTRAAPQPSTVPPQRVTTLAPEPERRSTLKPGPERRPEPEAPGAQARWLLDPREYPWLSTYARNLTALAMEGRLDPALGRDGEIDELLDILGKRRANNPVLVGEPGVGKTAIVEGLAQRMLGASENRVLVELDVGGLVAGTQLRGSFSERLIGIKDEVKRAEGRVIVFIDELHMLIGAGSAGEGPQDAANELKAALARGESPCVGATPHDEFRKYIQEDGALERRFVPVLVREPSPQKTREILEGAAPH